MTAAISLRRRDEGEKPLADQIRISRSMPLLLNTNLPTIQRFFSIQKSDSPLTPLPLPKITWATFLNAMASLASQITIYRAARHQVIRTFLLVCKASST
jgi:hypothetical protein